MAELVVCSWMRHKGEYYKKGDKIEGSLLNKKQMDQLIEKGVIAPLSYKELGVIKVNTPKIEQSHEALNHSENDESVDVILNLNFELDELKSGAKEQGLEWKGNISKPNLIKLIIDNGKEDYFLGLLEDE